MPDAAGAPAEAAAPTTLRLPLAAARSILWQRLAAEAAALAAAFREKARRPGRLLSQQQMALLWLAASDARQAAAALRGCAAAAWCMDRLRLPRDLVDEVCLGLVSPRHTVQSLLLLASVHGAQMLPPRLSSVLSTAAPDGATRELLSALPG
eukprot:TRINITY_DN14691_c0_g1_i1.p3 TRINITY_DN14691_c0_g1~~TRINITY_DN14691_c0_g1_i1.p3  ORF type:complete len:175 (+),score=64.56 TRINITY_DN14691_c0_g1_i1:71-526(+)